MRKFERITVDPQVKNGVACIRDTGITVSEVVSKVVHEKTAEEILLEYPDLEATDVQDALAYAVSELLQYAAALANETTVPFASAMGFSQLITLKTETHKITEDQRIDFGKRIYKNVQMIKSCFRYYLDYAHLTYGMLITHHNLQSVSLRYLLRKATENLKSYNPSAKIQSTIPDDLPSISDNGYLEKVFYYLIIDTYFEKLNHDVEIVVTNHRQGVHIQITRRLSDETVNVDNIEFIYSYPLNPLNLAAFILHNYGDKIQTAVENNKVIFSFDLPIYQITYT